MDNDHYNSEKYEYNIPSPIARRKWVSKLTQISLRDILFFEKAYEISLNSQDLFGLVQN
jgi:hypothetical protein